MYNIVQRSTKPRLDGTCSICLYVYSRINGKLHTKYKVLKNVPAVEPKYWNGNRYKSTYKTSPGYRELNQRLATIEEQCYDIEDQFKAQGMIPTPKQFLSAFISGTVEDDAYTMLDAIDRVMELKVKMKKCKTHKCYKDFRRRWVAFCDQKNKGNRIPTSEFSLEHLEAFISYLQRGKGNGGAKQFYSYLRRSYNLSVREENTPDLGMKSPFKKFDSGLLKKKGNKFAKNALTPDQWEEFKSITPRTEKQEFWKDIFMFMVYARGVNFRDVIELRKEWIVERRDKDDNVVYAIQYVRHKTEERKPIALNTPITPEMQKIMDKHNNPDSKYIFDMVPPHIPRDTEVFEDFYQTLRNTVFNRRIRCLVKGTSLPSDLSSYVARHTFATVALRRGATIADIRDALGHSNIATTENYLGRKNASDLDDTFKDLL